MTEPVNLKRALELSVEGLIDARLGALRRELIDELNREVAAAVGHAGGAASSGPSTGTADLNQAVQRVLQPTGQTEIMTSCIQSGARFASRAILFVRRGEGFGFWRAEGCTPEVTAALRGITIPEVGLLKEIAESHQTRTSALASDDMPPTLRSALGITASSNAHLFPIAVQGRVVAALYADGAAATSIQPDALDVLTRVTGLSLETAASRAAITARPTASAAETPIAQSRQSSSGSSPGASEAATEEQASAAADAANPEPADAAAPAPDSQSVFSPPLPGSFAASIPSVAEGEAAIPPPPDVDSLPEGERDAHRRAHRFARVAVQDLLSYHKSKIEQGRREKNLYSLLKDDINKTRENYEHRFGQTPASAFDYLHYELVIKLAANDPSALGSQYPGALSSG